MKIGLNWTAPQHLPVAQSLLQSGTASFCEIMADNFLHVPADDLRSAFPNTPTAFHIMNSQFILRDAQELRALARQLMPLIASLSPMYLSDHLALFSHEDRQMPFIFEIDYERQYPLVRERVTLWQDLMGTPMCFENFPSVLDHGRAQPDFLQTLMRETGCGVLFDFSNAVVANKNCGVPLGRWEEIIRKSKHFHAAGYLPSETNPVIIRDSHDGDLSPETLSFLKQSRALPAEPENCTLVIERDSNISGENWSRDIENARAALR